MAGIKIREELESFYKLKTVLILAFIGTFLLENNVITFLENPALQTLITNRFVSFFSDAGLLGLYGTLIGLLLTAYAMIVAILPLFSTESMARPIFSQINRLFVFTILDGVILLMVFFTGGFGGQFKLPYTSSSGFVDVEIFLFLSLIIGLIFCVMTLSDLFKIIRRGGSRKQADSGKKG